MLVEKPLQPFVHRVHLLHGVHGVVGRADLPDDGPTHDPVDPVAQLSILFAMIVLVGGGQDLVAGVFDGLIPFDIRVDDLVKIGFIPADLFKIAVTVVAGEPDGRHEGRLGHVSHRRRCR